MGLLKEVAFGTEYRVAGHGMMAGTKTKNLLCLILADATDRGFEMTPQFPLVNLEFIQKNARYHGHSTRFAGMALIVEAVDQGFMCQERM